MNCAIIVTSKIGVSAPLKLAVRLQTYEPIHSFSVLLRCSGTEIEKEQNPVHHRRPSPPFLQVPPSQQPFQCSVAVRSSRGVSQEKDSHLHRGSSELDEKPNYLMLHAVS